MRVFVVNGVSALNYILLAYAALIILGWLTTTLLFLDKVNRFIHNLRDIESDLSRSTKPANLDSKKIEELSDLFSRSGGMHHYFKVYRRKFIAPTDAGSPFYKSGVDASLCFDKDSILRNTLMLKFYRVFPVVLVACGFIGSLFGVAATFYSARNIEWNASLTSLNEQFPELMALALQSSLPLIFSVSCALIFRVLCESNVNRTSQIFYRIVNLLDEVFPPWTLEQISSENLSENRKNREILQEFSLRYFDNLDKVVASHRVKVEALVHEFQELHLRAMQSQEDSLQRMTLECKTLADLSKRYFAVFERQIADFKTSAEVLIGDGVQELVHSNQTQGEAVSRQILELRKAITGAVDSVVGTSSSVLQSSQAVAQAQEASAMKVISQISPLAEQMGAQMERVLSQAQDKFSKMLVESLSSPIAEMRQWLRQATEDLESVKGSNQALAKGVVEKVKKLLVEVSDSLRIVGEELKGENAYLIEILRKAIDSSEKLLSKEISENLEPQRRELSDISQSVSVLANTSVRKEHVNMLIDHVNKLSEFLETIPLSAVEIVHVPRNLRGVKVASLSSLTEDNESGSHQHATRIKSRDAS